MVPGRFDETSNRAPSVLQLLGTAIRASRWSLVVIGVVTDHAQRLFADGHSGPFDGVPMLLKDDGQESARTPHWVGTPVVHRCGAPATETTPLVSAFERLGFVIVGKTNLPELS